MGAELVIFDVDVEVPQRKANDVRRVERVAVAFSLVLQVTFDNYGTETKVILESD